MTTSAGTAFHAPSRARPSSPRAPRALVAGAALVLAVAGAAGLVGSLAHVEHAHRPRAATLGQSSPGQSGVPQSGVAQSGVAQSGVAHRLAKFPSFGPLGRPLGMASAARAAEPATAGPAKAATPGATSSTGTAAAGERIEETGTLTVIVPKADIQADIGRLMALAEGLGGFVASTETQSASPGALGSVTLDVPVATFATAVSEARALGKVAMLSTQATDVTGRYVDLQAQITAAEDTRQQYLTIMSKAKTIGAILAVQAQLDDVDSQLQQLQGELKQLSSETTDATLTVTLTQKVVPPPPPKPVGSLLKAWRAAVGRFVAGFEAVVRVAGPLSFALLLLATLYFGGRVLWRLRRRRAPSSLP